MMLSGEQTRVAMHGIGKEPEWSMIERPVGRSNLVPAWCTGAHVNWMDDYSNPPDVRLKVDCEARRWEDKRYRKEGNHYRAYHADGRMEQYSHGSALYMDKVRRWKSHDGSLHSYAPTGETGTYNSETRQFDNPKGEWVEVERLCTTRQEGFGGSHYDIILEDGTEVVLRGPWHTSGPAGYTEVAYVYPGASWRGQYRRPQPWYKMTGMAGLLIRDEVFVAIMSRFLPHLELARVKEHGMEDIQPLKPEWDAPKCVVRAREWEARRQAKAGAS
jgi:hypothetical protein